jgi:LPXTG-motif cell wall-anchored protein
MKVKVTSRRVLTFSFLLGLVLLFFGGGTNTQALPPETTLETPDTTDVFYGPTPSCPDVDGVPQYPQSYYTDAPCGPVDPCVGIDPETGQGTTLWMIQPCSVDIPTSAAAVATPTELPQTGASEIFFIIGALVLFAGITLTVASRRS